MIEAYQRLIFDRIGTLGGLIFSIGLVPAFILTNTLILNYVFEDDDLKWVFKDGPLSQRVMYILVLGACHAPGIAFGFLGVIACCYNLFRTPSETVTILRGIGNNWKRAPFTCLAVTVVGILTFPFLMFLLQSEKKGPYDIV
jgi:hypothetical protein